LQSARARHAAAQAVQSSFLWPSPATSTRPSKSAAHTPGHAVAAAAGRVPDTHGTGAPPGGGGGAAGAPSPRAFNQHWRCRAGTAGSAPHTHVVHPGVRAHAARQAAQVGVVNAAPSVSTHPPASAAVGLTHAGHAAVRGGGPAALTGADVIVAEEMPWLPPQMSVADATTRAPGGMADAGTVTPAWRAGSPATVPMLGSTVPGGAPMRRGVTRSHASVGAAATHRPVAPAGSTGGGVATHTGGGIVTPSHTDGADVTHPSALHARRR